MQIVLIGLPTMTDDRDTIRNLEAALEREQFWTEDSEDFPEVE